MKVFVTDANYKHTLGVIRALGTQKIEVIAGASTRHAQSFYSKYCKSRKIYPNPENEEKFLKSIKYYLKKNKIDVLLPIGYNSTIILSKHKETVSKYTRLPIMDWESMKIAANKNKTMKLAQKIGIKMPKLYKKIEDIKEFPVVVKENKESGHVKYVNSIEELNKINIKDSIIQEFIPGKGYGFFSLFNKGKIQVFFMHKRVREFPTTGGPSTAAISIYDSKLKSIGEKILKSLNWHGVAMVEFKKDIRDNEFKLIEINPKFWGSLDLALASGINFPYLTVKMALEKKNNKK